MHNSPPTRRRPPWQLYVTLAAVACWMISLALTGAPGWIARTITVLAVAVLLAGQAWRWAQWGADGRVPDIEEVPLSEITVQRQVRR